MTHKFVPGKKYLLKLSDMWLRHRSERRWNNQVVTFVKTVTDINDVSLDVKSWDDPDPFTCAVTCPGLTTSYIDDVFLAKPGWLFELPTKETYISPFTGKAE